MNSSSEASLSAAPRAQSRAPALPGLALRSQGAARLRGWSIAPAGTGASSSAGPPYGDGLTGGRREVNWRITGGFTSPPYVPSGASETGEASEMEKRRKGESASVSREMSFRTPLTLGQTGPQPCPAVSLNTVLLGHCPGCMELQRCRAVDNLTFWLRQTKPLACTQRQPGSAVQSSGRPLPRQERNVFLVTRKSSCIKSKSKADHVWD